MAKALSACASRGLSPDGAQKALNGLRDAGMGAAELLFGSEIKAPEGISPEDAMAEREAKRARTPKILGDWMALAAKDPDKAQEAFYSARDWAREAEWGTWGAMPEDAGWRDVMARQKRWHEMVQQRERSEKSAISWDGLSPGWSDPQTGFSAVPLTDGGMLWDEGKAMRHCVSSYASECEQGNSRIFSIRKDGERFGTAEVKVSDGSFKVVQFKGLCNRLIEDERAWAAANAAAAQCRAAMSAKKSAENERIDPDITSKLLARRGALAAEPGPAPAPPALG